MEELKQAAIAFLFERCGPQLRGLLRSPPSDETAALEAAFASLAHCELGLAEALMARPLAVFDLLDEALLEAQLAALESLGEEPIEEVC